MIRLGVRLTVRGGSEAAIRLLVTSAAVALGVGLLLITLAGISAVGHQNMRYDWLESSSSTRPAAGPVPADPTLWLLRAEYYQGAPIGRLDLAAKGPGSPVPPGIPRLPGPGQYYASPALARLIRSVPAAQLADRYPGHLAGIIGPAALPAPGFLLVIVGHGASQLARVPGAQRVTGIATTSPAGCNGPQCVLGLGIDSNGIDLILSTVAAGLLFPVLIFIGASSRLSAARREQRFAAMRLAGATARQVAAISAVESAMAALAGVAGGFALYFALRPVVASFPLTGEPFFTSDLSLTLAEVLAVAVGVPAAAAVVSWLALRRVRISPLGVSRRVTPRPPRARRLLVLAAGLAELSFFAATGHPMDSSGQIKVFLPGFLLVLAGLVAAGPWLTMLGARVLARRASRPDTLIAARRLADNPHVAFRAISGLVLTLFVTTVTLGVITSIDANRKAPPGTISTAIVTDQFTADGQPGPGSVPAISGALLAQLDSIPGVQGAAVVHTDSTGVTITDAAAGVPDLRGAIPAGLVSCAQLARIPALGRCPADAGATAIPEQIFAPGRQHSSRQDVITWPSAGISAQRLARLPVKAIAVGTNGSAAAVEQARTALEAAYPLLNSPTTLGETYFDSNLSQWQQLADVLIIASLVVGGCTLAVSVAGGLSDRKRPFSLLRLTGVPLSLLRRVVALESGVPLLLAAILAIGLGFLTAQLYLGTELQYWLAPPGLEYYVVAICGLAAALGIITSTLPLLKRITGPETARNE